MNGIKKIVLVVIISLITTVIYGQQYKLWMGKQLKKLEIIEYSEINRLNIIETDVKSMYFPYFFIGDKHEAQLHYFGQFHLTDSILIFEYQNKRSHINHPHIKSFIIRLDEITEYEIDGNNGIIIKTDKLNYVFLSSLSENFKKLLIEKIDTE